MPRQRKYPLIHTPRTYFRVFVSGANINDEVRTAAAHVKDASADYCAAHGIEPEHLMINLQSVLPEGNGHRLTYVMAHRAVYE